MYPDASLKQLNKGGNKNDILKGNMGNIFTTVT